MPYDSKSVGKLARTKRQDLSQHIRTSHSLFAAADLESMRVPRSGPYRRCASCHCGWLARATALCRRCREVRR